MISNLLSREISVVSGGISGVLTCYDAYNGHVDRTSFSTLRELGMKVAACCDKRPENQWKTDKMVGTKKCINTMMSYVDLKTGKKTMGSSDIIGDVAKSS